MSTPSNNQCQGCNLFTTSPTGYCENCTRIGRAPGSPPPSGGPPPPVLNSDSIVFQRHVAVAPQASPFGLKRLRSEDEIGRTEHPDQRLNVGDAQIRFGGRDPDIFDRIHNLCKAMVLVADDLRSEVRSMFVAGPVGGSTSLTRPMTGGTPGAVDRRTNLVKLMQLIADDMKRFSQKDEETWLLIRRLRSLAVELETFLDLGGEARSVVRGLREMSGDLQTHVERRRGF